MEKYRVDVDFIDHCESKLFSNKKDAFAFARELDWATTVHHDLGERYGWQVIGKKERYSHQVFKVEF